MSYLYALKSYLLKFIFIVFFSLICVLKGKTATIIPILNPDSLIIAAKQKNVQKQYNEAIIDLKSALKQSPEYLDVALMLSRTFAYQSKYDSAQFFLDKAVAINRDDYQVRLWDTNLQLWQENFEKVVTKSSAALGLFEADSMFMVLKAKSLFELKRYKEALPLFETLHQKNVENQDIKYLYRICKVKSMKNQVGAHMGFDFFSNNPNNRTFTQVDWKHERDKVIYNPKFSVANRFSVNSYMGEIDIYPKIGDKVYLFTSIGFSDGLLFPNFRLMVEPFWAFKKNYELSGGVRFLQYPNSSVTLLTSSFTRYQGNWWLNGRLYLGIEKAGTGFIGELAARRYLKNEFNFLELRTGYGSSPENFYLTSAFNELGELLGSRSLNFVLTYQQPINLRWLFKIWGIADFQQPEQRENFNIYSIYVGLWYRF